MRHRIQTFAAAFLLLSAATVIAQTQQPLNTQKFKAVIAAPHAVKVAPAAVEQVATVKPEPAPNVGARPAPNLGALLQKANLPIEALSAGKIVAANDGRAEAVNASTIGAKIQDRRVLIEEVGSAAKPVKLSPSLRAAINKGVKVDPRNANQAQPAPEGLQLSFRLTAYQPGVDAPIKLVPVMYDQVGLLFDAAVQGYTATFEVVLLNEGDQDASGDLERPVSVVFDARDADDLRPRTLKFERYGPEQPGEVTVHVFNPEKDDFPVAASANFGATYNHVSLPVSRPKIRVIHPMPDIIPGWGIGTTTLVVKVDDIRSPRGFRILFGGNTTGLSPNPVELDDQGSGTMHWRSNGLGTATIDAAMPGFQADPVNVTFETPLRFLLLAIIGGLVGAFLRGRGRRRWQQALVIGAVSALFMVVAYAVGLRDWVTRIPGGDSLADSGEAVIVVLGALAALVGVSAIVPTATKKKKSA